VVAVILALAGGVALLVLLQNVDGRQVEVDGLS